MSLVATPKISHGKKLLPPLENGDHLDQKTFHERYEAMPPNIRAELIGGVVFMASPVGKVHSKEHVRVITWLGNYEADTPGVEALSNPTVILSKDCEPQPDVALRLLKGKTKIVRRGDKQTEFIAGSPELVIEVASSTESLDLNAKRRDYEKYGVDEYITLLVRTRSVAWLIRKNGKFAELKPGSDGILKSRVFPGLWLDPIALLAGDMRRVNEVLNRGLDTLEHAKFIAYMTSRKP